MIVTKYWTTKDLDELPDDEWQRYEIINGELFVSKTPHYNHQFVCSRICNLLFNWNDENKLGKATTVPGVIFSDDNNVIPDVVWISNERLGAIVAEDGHFHGAPELVIEVLSPGSDQETRDRETKRNLYSRRGVDEYWIINWPDRQFEVYRRAQNTSDLELVQTLNENDTLQSPLLPGFSCQVSDVFVDVITNN